MIFRIASLMPSSPRLLLACLLLGSSWSASAQDSAAAAASIATAKEHLANNRFLEGLSAAQNAVHADPGNYRGYYYVAYAHFNLGELEQARAAVGEALRLSPEDARPKITELSGLIGKEMGGKDQSNQHVAAADEAFNAGLMAKAASLYAKAYESAPGEGRLGLKAASIYAQNLGQLLEAATLWNKLAVSQDATTAAQAQGKLEEYAKDLEQAYRESTVSPTLESLTALLPAFPRRGELWLAVAVFHARKNDVKATITHLAAAAKNGVTKDKVAEQKAFQDLMLEWDEGGHFESFLNDAFGDEVAQTFLIQEAARKMEQKGRDEEAREAQRAEEKRRKVALLKEKVDQQRLKTINTINQFIARTHGVTLRVARSDLFIQKVIVAPPLNPLSYDAQSGTYTSQTKWEHWKNGVLQHTKTHTSTGGFSKDFQKIEITQYMLDEEQGALVANECEGLRTWLKGSGVHSWSETEFPDGRKDGYDRDGVGCFDLVVLKKDFPVIESCLKHLQEIDGLDLGKIVDDGGIAKTSADGATSSSGADIRTAASGSTLYQVTGIQAGDTLNIRERASASSALVVSLPNGTPGIQITGATSMNGSDEWVPISVQGKRGWTRPKYLTPMSNP